MERPQHIIEMPDVNNLTSEDKINLLVKTPGVFGMLANVLYKNIDGKNNK